MLPLPPRMAQVNMGTTTIMNRAYRLHPLNPYGISKNEFDKWALREEKQPPFWTGLEIF